MFSYTVYSCFICEGFPGNGNFSLVDDDNRIILSDELRIDDEIVDIYTDYWFCDIKKLDKRVKKTDELVKKMIFSDIALLLHLPFRQARKRQQLRYRVYSLVPDNKIDRAIINHFKLRQSEEECKSGIPDIIYVYPGFKKYDVKNAVRADLTPDEKKQGIRPLKYRHFSVPDMIYPGITKIKTNGKEISVVAHCNIHGDWLTTQNI